MDNENIFRACSSDNVKAVKKFLENGFRINEEYEYGHVKTNLLFFTIYHRSVNVFRELLNWQPDLEARNNDGDTLLIASSRIGKEDIVIELLSKGVNINFQNRNGNTALIIAAIHGRINVIKSLLLFGADIKIENNNDCDFFHHLDKSEKKEIKEFISSLVSSVKPAKR